MTKRSGFAVAALLCAAALGQAGGLSDDLKAMQGTWMATILEVDGKTPSDEEKKTKIKLVVKEDGYQVYESELLLSEGVFKLDSAKNPKTLDATFKAGPLKGKTQPAIYILEKDEMQILFSLPGKKRATTFKTTAGTEEVLMKYTRLKAAAGS